MAVIIEGCDGGSQTSSPAAAAPPAIPSKAHCTPCARLSIIGQPGVVSVIYTVMRGPVMAMS